jgi:hypothetical protein
MRTARSMWGWMTRGGAARSIAELLPRGHLQGSVVGRDKYLEPSADHI